MPDRYSRPRGLMAIIGVAALIAFVTLGLSIQNAVAINHQQDQRNRDRIASDLAGCARGNVFRQQVIDQGEAVDVLMTGTLDTAFAAPPGSPPERVEQFHQFRARFDEPLAAYRKAVSSIRLIDCQAVTPGATE